MRYITKNHPEKTLIRLLSKKSGRNSTGKVTARHQGGRQKRFYRSIDFHRNKFDVVGVVEAFEYDPNRNVHIALIHYVDGEKRYILTPLGLKIGDKIMSGNAAEVKPGNAMPLSKIPIGTPIHNLEIHKKRGGQIVRGAGTTASVLARDAGSAQVKLPSGEIRLIADTCFATIGQLAVVEAKSVQLGTAGRARRMGRRPHVRGTAMHPNSHPHGGGEGRSGEGMHPKTPWGKSARGNKTRNKKKYSNKYILQRRK
jgi:large subunit ribosomal protein L2